jgi:hypothetical protein
MSFLENKFAIVRGYIDPPIMDLFYQYCKLQVNSAGFKKMNSESYNPDWDGRFGDSLVANTYARYADPLWESLLLSSVKPLEHCTGLSIVPNFSYWRFYQEGDVLIKHSDRPGCEISVTLCIGYEGENWPLFIESENYTGPILLEPGDMLVYKGREVPHWREEFKGVNQAQVFLQYDIAGNEDNNFLDKKPMPAIPITYSLNFGLPSNKS